MRVYKRFDLRKQNGVSLDDIYTLLEETPNNYFTYIFKSMEAVNEDTGLIGSSEFIKVFCTYCSFGKEEILKMLFLFADTKHLSKRNLYFKIYYIFVSLFYLFLYIHWETYSNYYYNYI